MATYRQDITRYEQGYGNVTINIILADSYDNLFSTSFYDIDIIDFEDIDVKTENSIGQLATDEASFGINEAAISKDNVTIVADAKTQRTIDNEALDLCKNSTSANFNYIGVFVNTSGTQADINDSLFIGAIDFDYEDDHQRWSGAEFDTAITPLRNYKFKTTPVQESLFDAISLQTVIDNAKANILGASTQDRAAAYEDGDWASYYSSLIRFDSLLEYIKEQYVTELQNAGYGTFTIDFTKCELDGHFIPIRFKRPLADKITGHIVDYEKYTEILVPSATKNTGKIWEFDVDAKKKIYITRDRGGGILGTDDTNFLYINVNNILDSETIKTDKSLTYRNEALTDTQEQFLWQNNERVDDSLTKLLYSIATDLGLILRFEFISQNSIDIKFITRSNIDEGQVYLKDSTSASGKKFNLDKREENNKITGVHNYLVLEDNKGYGYDRSFHNADGNKHLPENSKGYNEKTGKRSLLSISPSFWEVSNKLENKYVTSGVPDNRFIQKNYKAPGVDTIRYLYGMTIPHNTYLKNTASGNPVDHVPWNAASLDTTLMMYTAKKTGETYVPANYYTPVGGWYVNIDGTDRVFTSLEDYRESVNNIDKRDYGKELEITSPYLMCIATASNGSDADIKNLRIGKKLIFDGVEYVITGYNINIESWEVKLKLENTGRFDYSESTTFETVDGKHSEIQADDSEDEEEIITKSFTASGSISEGEFVSLKTASTVERSVCSNTHYNRLLGVALNDAADTEGVNVQTSGKVAISWLAGSVNDAVFIRDVSGTENLSTTQLTAKSGSEDLYAEVGIITDTNEMRIDIKERFVLL